DRCNLRCEYCMPAEGLEWLPRPQLLSAAEFARLAGIAVGLGVRSIRLTGGEPLLRRDLVDIVSRLAALRPRPELSLTTNGIGLDRLAAGLAEAGLDRVNVSLDTLDAQTFAEITHRDRLPEVLRGLRAAREAGLEPVKLNAVLLRGREAEAPRLLDFALHSGYELRFIEAMPLDAQHGWRREQMVSAAEILELLGKTHQLTPLLGRGSAPAESFEVDGGPARVGVIGSVTRPFCAACDRLRLTADGNLRNCLFAREETDLRGPLRAGADDAELAAIMASCVAGKRKGHGIGEPEFRQPDRPMSAIGG
ncbi:MAG: GTP 3',8-cyclase MoaA, partial [Mycobacteriales bacterium]